MLLMMMSNESMKEQEKGFQKKNCKQLEEIQSLLLCSIDVIVGFSLLFFSDT